MPVSGGHKRDLRKVLFALWLGLIQKDGEREVVSQREDENGQMTGSVGDLAIPFLFLVRRMAGPHFEFLEPVAERVETET